MTNEQPVVDAARAAFEDIIDEAPLAPDWVSVTGQLQRLHRDKRRRRPALALVGVAALLFVLVGSLAGLSLLLRSYSRNDDAVSGTTRAATETTATPTTVATPTPTSAPPDQGVPLVLSDLVVDVPLVYWPTVAPAGWEVCRQFEDASRGDQICEPDADGFIGISLTLDTPVEGRPPGPLPGSSLLSNGDMLVLSMPINDVGYVLNVTSQGLSTSDLTSVAASIPLVGTRRDFAPVEEPILDVASLSDDDVASMLPGEMSAPTVVRDRRSFNVFGDSMTLTVTDEHWLPQRTPLTVLDRLPRIPLPRLIPGADRPVVIGESASGWSYATWDQGGYSWFLEGRGSADEMRRRALDAIASIASLAS